jgi:DNA-binding HxlR family transcriptional regulator
MGDIRFVEYPEDFCERMDGVLKCVNGENKVISLLHLNKEGLVRGELYDRIMDNIGGVDFVTRDTIDRFCTNLLYEVGFVGRGIVRTNRQATNKYFLTDAGENFGQPIAALSLKYSVEHDKSMIDFLGQSSSPSRFSTPYNRYAVLKSLVGKKMRVQDLIEIHGESVKKMIEGLRNSGLVTHESLRRGRDIGGWSKYSWVEGQSNDEVKPVRSYRALTERVVEHMSNNGEGDRISVAHALDYGDVRAISSILKGLEREGVVERTCKWDPKKMSEISLTNDGHEFLEDFLEVVERAVNDPRELMDFYKEFRQGRHYKEYLKRGAYLGKKKRVIKT